MHNLAMTIKEVDPGASIRYRQVFTAVGGLMGAVAASSCCILPLLLFSLGVSGAWIGNLTRLAPYQPYFIAIAHRFSRLRLLARLPLIEDGLHPRRNLWTAIAEPPRQVRTRFGNGACRCRDQLRRSRNRPSQLMNGDDT